MAMKQEVSVLWGIRQELAQCMAWRSALRKEPLQQVNQRVERGFQAEAEQGRKAWHK